MALSLYSQKSNAWREYLNPLKGLTFARLTSLQEAGECGRFADLQWMYYFMERSDPMIFAVLQRRTAALVNSDWDIRMVSDAVSGRNVDTKLAEEQAAFLRSVYERIDNFKESLRFLMTGVYRGFAHLEKHEDAGGNITRLEPVEQWFWVRDGMFGDWEYNENAVSGRQRGHPIERENFVIYEGVPLDRLLGSLYIHRAYAMRDMATYLEVFGVPATFLVGPPGISVEKELEYLRIAEDLVNNGRGYLPNGSDIKYVTGGGGKAPFFEALAYLDKMVTMVGTGGLLTMLSESGTGTLAGSAHADTFLQVARGDAVTLSEVLQKDLDGPLLEMAFPGAPHLAYFEVSPTVPDQAARVLQDVGQLAAAGLQVDPAEVSEKTGYRLLPAGVGG